MNEQQPIRIESLDHLVLTVRDLPTTVAFYTRVLGMRLVRFGEGRLALEFGSQKINLHRMGHEYEPKSAHPTPGSADLCFILASRLSDVVVHLRGLGVTVEDGPVTRVGALGPMESIYLRDPDGNLIELSNYVDDDGDAEAGLDRPPILR
ncbi:MAG TPA: VOC family protein [Thermomicrobiales bacterium]|nr:VOC family protein [Thermomicrobiales bacterium]